MPNPLKVKDLVNNTVLEPEVFDYVIVATGHYSTPHVPHFEVLIIDRQPRVARGSARSCLLYTSDAADE